MVEIEDNFFLQHGLDGREYAADGTPVVYMCSLQTMTAPYAIVGETNYRIAENLRSIARKLEDGDIDRASASIIYTEPDRYDAGICTSVYNGEFNTSANAGDFDRTMHYTLSTDEDARRFMSVVHDYNGLFYQDFDLSTTFLTGEIDDERPIVHLICEQPTEVETDVNQ